MCSTCDYLKRLAACRDDVDFRLNVKRTGDSTTRRDQRPGDDYYTLRDAESPKPGLLVDKPGIWDFLSTLELRDGRWRRRKDQ